MEKKLSKNNKKKTTELIIDFSKTKKDFQPICINGTETERETEAKVLGNAIINNLIWDIHVGEITRKAGKRPFLLLQLKRSGIPIKDLLKLYMTVAHAGIHLLCMVHFTHTGSAK